MASRIRVTAAHEANRTARPGKTCERGTHAHVRPTGLHRKAAMRRTSDKVVVAPEANTYGDTVASTPEANMQNTQRGWHEHVFGNTANPPSLPNTGIVTDHTATLCSTQQYYAMTTHPPAIFTMAEYGRSRSPDRDWDPTVAPFDHMRAGRTLHAPHR